MNLDSLFHITVTITWLLVTHSLIIYKRMAVGPWSWGAGALGQCLPCLFSIKYDTLRRPFWL